tara:strand:- start:3309 stop:4409 length:1101 start_codon:yes stop_codon:yes gene_type:complete
MGKKKVKKSKSNISQNNLPNVSICTPTFNRRPFFSGLIECIKNQDYPHNKIEWIIVDDGTDSIKDLFTNEETIKYLEPIKIRYFYLDEKMDLGKKRNYMHKKCTFTNDEDIIVYIDDDDYYPSERVSHSVKRLIQNKDALCGGSSELFLWFNTLNKMYKFGPYGPNHATAGTFAFKRKLLKDTSYEDGAILAEEKHFLKNYTIPFVQFDSLKTILVVSHEQNTFDKKKLLTKDNRFVKESNITVKNFIKDKKLEIFYHSEINELLKNYEPGRVENKPKVLKEIARKEKEREEMTKNALKNQENKLSGISIKNSNTNQVKELTINECKQLMIGKMNECENLKNEINKLKVENDDLKKENDDLKNKLG